MKLSDFDIIKIITPDFTLVSITKLDGSEIVCSWSDLYNMLVDLFDGENFYEVFPTKQNLVNGDDRSRHFWSGTNVKKFNLTSLPLYTTFSISTVNFDSFTGENPTNPFYWNTESYSNNTLI